MNGGEKLGIGHWTIEDSVKKQRKYDEVAQDRYFATDDTADDRRPLLPNGGSAAAATGFVRERGSGADEQPQRHHCRGKSESRNFTERERRENERWRTMTRRAALFAVFVIVSPRLYRKNSIIARRLRLRKFSRVDPRKVRLRKKERKEERKEGKKEREKKRTKERNVL